MNDQPMYAFILYLLVKKYKKEELLRIINRMYDEKIIGDDNNETETYN